MKICVVGAGAIGGWVAARLALAGNDVSVLARGETLSSIETEGLLVTEQGETCSVAVAAAPDPAALGRQDVVVIALKAPALLQIASSLRPLIAPETLIVPAPASLGGVAASNVCVCRTSTFVGKERTVLT